MKKFIFAALFALSAASAIFAIDSEKERMFEEFIDHGTYVKKIYRNGEIEWRVGNPKQTGAWINISDKKFEYSYVVGVDLTFDRWEMTQDEKGNLIFREKEGAFNKKK